MPLFSRRAILTWPYPAGYPGCVLFFNVELWQHKHELERNAMLWNLNVVEESAPAALELSWHSSAPHNTRLRETIFISRVCGIEV